MKWTEELLNKAAYSALHTYTAIINKPQSLRSNSQQVYSQHFLILCYKFRSVGNFYFVTTDNVVDFIIFFRSNLELTRLYISVHSSR